jgi:tetratricopeptide (TPR) repeat protein
MRNRYRLVSLLVAVFLLASLGGGTLYWFQDRFGDSTPRLLRVLSALSVEQAPADKLVINYPLDETLFPPDIVAPTFRWQDYLLDTDCWCLVFDFQAGGEPMRFLSDGKEWTPSEADWDTIKKRSQDSPVRITILGVQRTNPGKLLSGSSVSFGTSRDEVGAPIFFRDVNLPFAVAVKDPSKIRWRLGSISSREMPRLLLDGIPTCANCHSFSRDGKVYGMEVDAADDKGAYLISPVQKKVSICPENVISWSEFRKEEKKKTFGLLAQVSPDGCNVICMVKDRSVSIPIPDIEFSQLFFPIQGILTNYNIATKTFKAVPGASDPAYVQANVTWSPDGKEIAFARHETYRLEKMNSDVDQLVLSPDQAREFLEGGKPFQYDLYRLPYNDGNGGTPVPIEGASNNGMSNYFPKYSPDGKWIVFCRAKNYMLLQPDSELYIIPAAGGEARRLRCNTGRMNSWHSWSPNGKWLVFSSKVNGSYTQLHLTHIDEQGNSTPPVVLSHFTEPGRAANIPEFLNAPADAIEKIRQDYITDGSFVGAGDNSLKFNDYEEAVQRYARALEINPQNDHALNNTGFALLAQKKTGEAVAFLEKGVRLVPGNALLRYNYGNALSAAGKTSESLDQYHEAVRLDPTLASAWRDLGIALHGQQKFDRSEQCFRKAFELEPSNGDACYNLGSCLAKQGKWEQASGSLLQAVRLDPKNADAFSLLGRIAGDQGKYDEAERYYAQALNLQPNRTSSLREQATLLFAKGDFSKAETHLAQAARLDPQDAQSHYHLALVLYRQGKAEEGAKELASAAELDPKYQNAPEPLLMQSIHCAENSDFQQAQSFAQQALEKATLTGKSEIAQEVQTYLAAYREGKMPGNEKGHSGT